MAQHHPPRSHAIHSRVRSFSRSGGRLRPVQAEALAQLGPRYVVDVPRADAVRTVAAAIDEVLAPASPRRPAVPGSPPGAGPAGRGVVPALGPLRPLRTLNT